MSVDTSRPSVGGLAPPRSMTWQRRSEQILGRDWRTAYIFAFPMVLLLLGLIAYPFLLALWMSFFNVIGPNWGNWVGLNNYINQWSDPVFLDSFSITVRFTVFSVAIKFLLGLCAALLLHNIRRFQAILAPLVLLPFVVPEVVTATTWRFLFDPTFGGLNATLRVFYDLSGGLIGSERGIPWTGEAGWALASMILVNVWKGVPFFALLALAGLKAIDAELYDAAAVDGANPWQRFLHITLPSLRYIIIVETLLSTISTFNTFGLIYLITGGGPYGATRVYGVLAYEKIGGLRYSQGVAVALTMAPILLIAIIVLGRYMRQGQKGDVGEDTTAWRILMTILWPIRIVVRALVKVFWLVNDALETAFGAVAAQITALVNVGRPPQRPRSQLIARRLAKILMVLGLGLVILFELYPFYWVFIMGFKTNLQIMGFSSIFWPDPWTLENFRYVFFESDFALWLSNTVRVAIFSTLIGVLVSALGAYALVRLRWRGAGFLSTAMLITYLMPGIMMVIPLYQVFNFVHLTNRLESLIIAYPTFLMPFACWLLMGYYRSVPEELEDAAMIDGCTRLQAFFRIVLPLIAPALLAIAILAVTQAWNEFLFAFIFISSNSATTLQVGLGRMIVNDVAQWGRIMAMSLITAIPVMIFYSIGQRYLVQGLTAGSVKG